MAFSIGIYTLAHIRGIYGFNFHSAHLHFFGQPKAVIIIVWHSQTIYSHYSSEYALGFDSIGKKLYTYTRTQWQATTQQQLRLAIPQQ